MKKKVIVTGGSGFIGTNMVEYLLNSDSEVVNFDRSPPRNDAHNAYWIEGDICNKKELEELVIQFKPEYIIHLAARTDLNEKLNLNGYKANIEGVEHILEVALNTPTLKRVVIASSMLVCKLGYLPKDDFDYAPSTLYGESKVLTEKIARKFPIDWIIIRPTSIWGPWFDEPYRHFFELVLSGRYVNIGRSRSSTKTYGFVKNSVYQIYSLMTSQEPSVRNSVFYIGDIDPINISDWALLIRKLSDLKPVISVNLMFLKMLAIFGDMLGKLSISFPMTSFRLKNMTTDNVIPTIGKTYLVAPKPPYPVIDQATKETIEWIKKTDSI